MRYIHIICIGLIVLLLGASAKAEELKSDGNELLSACESEGITGEMWCLGYMNAIADTHWLYTEKILSWCVPPRVTMNQMRKVVVKYLQNHPEKLHYRDITLSVIAIREAFPCPVQSAPE